MRLAVDKRRYPWSVWTPPWPALMTTPPGCWWTIGAGGAGESGGGWRKGAADTGQTAPVAAQPESEPEHQAERRRLRRRRRARLKAAALGRSRGGLTSKVHLAAEIRCRLLAFVLTAGQAADSPRFIPVLEKIRVRGPVGRPRTRPGAVADKAYSSRANRGYLRKQKVKAVIPEKADQAANRTRRGSAGGRAVTCDAARLPAMPRGTGTATPWSGRSTS